MTNARVEVITSVERRRRWTAAEKERLVAASLVPGAVASAVAREVGLHPSQLYGWRRQLCARSAARSDFTAVRLAAEAGSACALAPASGVIDIEFASGVRMRISGAADAATVASAVAALAARDRRR
jgi:transposase